ncbi:MAG: hypothetical protein HQ523_15190 [Lentisphaerae bacterium]|nr:hypothetical protein [Lentisphaerota bacterium]
MKHLKVIMGVLLSCALVASSRAQTLRFEAEDALVSPTLGTTASPGNNEYEDFSGWSVDSDNSLILYSSETIAEADVITLTFTGLSARTSYDVEAVLAYMPGSVEAYAWYWQYDYGSAARAVSGVANLFLRYDHFLGTFVGLSTNRYRLARAVTSSAGEISFYGGNKRHTGASTSDSYSGFDYFDLTPVALVTQATYEAEDIIQSPMALIVETITASSGNNEYENYTGWPNDSGNSLIVNSDETIAEATNVPFLLIPGLTPNREHRLHAWINYTPSATENWTNYYSSVSRADAIGAGAQTVTIANLDNPGGASWVVNSTNRYALASVVSDDQGHIRLFLGSFEYTSAKFVGWDRIEIEKGPDTGTVVVIQ